MNLLIFQNVKGGENLLFSVYRDANVWPKAEVEDPALGQMSNFIWKRFLFICNNIDTNLNENFYT